MDNQKLTPHAVLKQQPSIKRIAKKAGLHYQTVREILLGIHSSEKTRRQVLDILMRELEEDIQRKELFLKKIDKQL